MIIARNQPQGQVTTYGAEISAGNASDTSDMPKGWQHMEVNSNAVHFVIVDLLGRIL